MIVPEQLIYVGLEERETGEQVCRACAGKRWGAFRVDKVFNGLASAPEGWERMILYTAIEDAIAAGYDMPYGCGEKACRKSGDGYCEECARCACVDCGQDLAEAGDRVKDAVA
jgi:hypothetical protein